MENTRFELVTSCMRSKHSTPELIPPFSLCDYIYYYKYFFSHDKSVQDYEQSGGLMQ